MLHHTCDCTDGLHATPSIGYHDREYAAVVARHTGRHIVAIEAAS